MQPSQKARDWSSLEQSLESAFSVPSQPFVTPQPVVFQPAFQQQSQQDDWGDFQVKSFSDNLSTPDGSKGQFFISRHHAHVVWNEPTILVRSPQIVNRGRRFGARGSVFSCRSEAKPRPIWKKNGPKCLKSLPRLTFCRFLSI
jgi:hypothetical protein